MIQLTYRVHSVGPGEVPVEATLPGGRKLTVADKVTVAELVAEGGHGTVKLLLPPDARVNVGDVVRATFERVEGGAA